MNTGMGHNMVLLCVVRVGRSVVSVPALRVVTVSQAVVG